MQNDNEPLVLSLETATRAGSVSVARGARILASIAGDASASHSTDLIANVERVLREARIELTSIDFFAAAHGPGSFTGLRIGLATVKSLAVSMKKRCAGVSTLAAVALDAGVSERTVALLPAGRGEVFVQMFAVNGDMVAPLDAAAHITPEHLLAEYGDFSRLRWAGEGAHQQLERLRTEAERRGFSWAGSTAHSSESGWTIAPAQAKLAEAVARLALPQWRSGNLIEPHNLRANYLRVSDAEMKAHV